MKIKKIISIALFIMLLIGMGRSESVSWQNKKWSVVVADKSIDAIQALQMGYDMEDLYISMLGYDANGQIVKVWRGEKPVTVRRADAYEGVPIADDFKEDGSYCTAQHEGKYPIYAQGEYENDYEKRTVTTTKYYYKTSTWGQWIEDTTPDHRNYNNARSNRRKTETSTETVYDYTYAGYGIGVSDADGNLLAVLAIEHIYGFGSYPASTRRGSSGSNVDYPTVNGTLPGAWVKGDWVENVSANNIISPVDYDMFSNQKYYGSGIDIYGYSGDHLHFHGGDQYWIIAPEPKIAWCFLLGICYIIYKRKLDFTA